MIVRAKRHLHVAAYLGTTLTLSQGCDDTCTGPHCEATWAATDLAIHQPSTWSSQISPLRDALVTVVGNETQGVAWTVRSTDGLTLVGVPSARRVIAITAPNSSQSLADIAAGLVFVSDDDSFGSSIAMAGNRVAIGAPHSKQFAGTVWVFRDLPSEGRVDADNAIRLVGTTSGDHTGHQVLACPDVDGDGLSEWLITAPQLSGERVLSGGVWWVLSSALTDLPPGSVPIAQVGTLWAGANAGDRFGGSALCGQDIDNDGAPDLLIGAPLAGPENQGELTLIHPFPATQAPGMSPVTTRGTIPHGWLGTSLSSGRFDESDRLLIVAGAPGADEGLGRVLLFDAATLSSSGRSRPIITVRSDTPDGNTPHFGRSVAVADLDNDGLDDLIVGSPDATVAGKIGAGRLHVWRGATWPTRLTGQADHTVSGTHAFQRVGRWTSLADADDDGFIELYLSLRAEAER